MSKWLTLFLAPSQKKQKLGEILVSSWINQTLELASIIIKELKLIHNYICDYYYYNTFQAIIMLVFSG